MARGSKSLQGRLGLPETEDIVGEEAPVERLFLNRGRGNRLNRKAPKAVAPSRECPPLSETILPKKELDLLVNRGAKDHRPVAPNPEKFSALLHSLQPTMPTRLGIVRETEDHGEMDQQPDSDEPHDNLLDAPQASASVFSTFTSSYIITD